MSNRFLKHDKMTEAPETKAQGSTIADTSTVNVNGVGEVLIDLNADILDSTITISDPEIEDAESGGKLVKYKILGTFTITNSMDTKVIDPKIDSVSDK